MSTLTFMQRIAITQKLRHDWYLAMAKTAAEGLSQTDVLEKLKYNFRKTKHPLAPLIDMLLQRLRGGKSTSKVDIRTIGSELMGLVPDDECLLIMAGESSGRIENGFINAAERIESQQKLIVAIRSSLVKPLVYLGALIGLLLYFSFKLLPSFEKSRPRDKWPPEAAALGWIADHIIIIVVCLAIFLIIFTVSTHFLNKLWVGEYRDIADRSIPPFNLLARISAATFISSIAGFVSAGIPFSDAISKIRISGNKYMKYQCDRIQMMMRSGKRIDQCLVNLPMINMQYHWIIEVYSMSSDSSHAYTTISKEMIEKTTHTISVIFGGIISNIMLIATGASVMWIYVSMFAIADIK
jgi:type II secretory pathway component PulF